MEVILEISQEEAQKLNITSEKLTLSELKKKIAMAELVESLKEGHEIAKQYGIDNWTMDEINNLIKEAKASYNDKDSD
jgi:coproporphyrinogen III oxidase-like Fe-S oxidoreductase